MATEPNEEKVTSSIKKTMDSLYSDIYYNTNEPNRTINLIKDKLDTSIRKISNVNFTNIGTSNISSLYVKSLDDKERADMDLIDSLNNTLNDKSLMDNVMSVYSRNTWLRAVDGEIDMVCKFMPKLEEALHVRMEHVLSADHFTKNSIMINAVGVNSKNDSIDDNLETLEKKYNIYKNLAKWYKDMDKRGEIFIYCVPYKKALQKLLDARSRMQSTDADGVTLTSANESEDAFELIDEDINLDTNHVINEEVTEFVDQYVEAAINESDELDQTATIQKGEIVRGITEQIGDIKIVVNTSGILSSAIRDYTKATKFCNENASLFAEDIGQEITKASEKQFNGDTNKENMAVDGTTYINKSTKNSINIPGCVLKQLDHTMVEPLYIDDTCLGYIYVECDKQIGLEQTTFSSTIGGIRPGGNYTSTSDPFAKMGNSQAILKNIADKLSSKLSAKFINANQDLSREIYQILRYNTTVDATGKISKVSLTFIPPEDMNHEFFDFNYETKHGISSIFRSLFTAKLFSYMYIGNVLQILTRGNDKRVIYVRQNIDKNIAGVLNNVINQLQMGNYGYRQIEDMRSVLGMMGRFNDYYIPRSQGGDAPVDFEVMPGQQTEPKTELMNMLEEMSVNPIVPIEVLSMRQQADYATHLSMTNTKFLQDIYNFQGMYEGTASRILTKVYNYEFNIDSNTQDQIKVTLPPPMYLNAINGAQILDSIGTLSDSMSKLQYPDEESDTQMEFARLLKKSLAQSILPKDVIDQCRDQAEMNIAKKPQEQ